MKFVNIHTLLKMPKGTVFCQSHTSVVESAKHNDYPIVNARVLNKVNGQVFYFTLVTMLRPVVEKGTDFVDKLQYMLDNLGVEVKCKQTELNLGKYFDDLENNYVYGIYSKEEVKCMIDILQQALKDGYEQ